MNQQISCTDCPLRKSGAFSATSAEEIEFIQSIRQRQMQVRAGHGIMREGDASSTLYTLLSGWAFRYRTLNDGRRQIFNFLLPGDFIGLQHQLGQASPHGVEALTDATLCAFPNERLWDIYRSHPGLGFDITWLCAHEELIVDENLLSVGRRSATERIAMLLIHLYKRAESVGLGGPDGVPFPLIQQHIADALGLSLVHTNKTLKRLQAMGLYTLGNGRLKLTHPAAMARLADYYAMPLRARPLI
ncbi:MAG: Crp/Fnr family transcriptional regulator [Thiobacillus sp.]|uniref:Crp/Fnr family transcriptional regulator n=1 Tax=Thiobacillus sp. TaxID=924 RepID=UPI00168C8A94|nr:Crp/Fnr family transcriptional regulator [Thiobacillus sp.]QLQ03841.1 MAG: Crp/Fnr family transcriptional regulator [Thiobacillus sp.]